MPKSIKKTKKNFRKKKRTYKKYRKTHKGGANLNIYYKRPDRSSMRKSPKNQWSLFKNKNKKVKALEEIVTDLQIRVLKLEKHAVFFKNPASNQNKDKGMYVDLQVPTNQDRSSDEEPQYEQPNQGINWSGANLGSAVKSGPNTEGDKPQGIEV